MLKKILPFLIILLLLIPIGLFIYFFKDKTIPDNRIDAIEVVPTSAVMILESRAVPVLVQLFNTKHQICEDLKSQDNFKPIIDGLMEVDSILIKDKILAGKLNLMPGILSIHQTGDKKFEPLLVLQSNGRLGYKDILKLAKQLTGVECEHEEKSYTRTKIHEIRFKDETIIPQIFIASVKKYLVISPSDILIEDVIRQARSGMSLNQDEDFKKAASVSGHNADANLYVEIERFTAMTSMIMNPGISGFMKELNRYGAWLELDITLREDMIVASGFGFTGDTLAWLDIFENQTPQKNQLDQVLPANTLSFISYGIEKPSAFFEKMKDLYKGSEYEQSRINSYTQLSREVGEDLSSAFADFMEHEAGIAWIPGENGKALPVVVIEVRSQNLASEKLISWLQMKARKENKKVQDYRFIYRPDQDRQHNIYQLPVSGIPESLFGNLFAEVEGKYFGFTENYLILSDDRQAIQDVIYHKELKRTLSTDQVYQSVIGQIGMRNNFVFYLAPFKSKEFLASKVNKEWAALIAENKEFVNRLGAVSMQVQSRNSKFYHNMFIRFSESVSDGPQTMWQSQLGTTLNFKPVFTINHNTKRKEIFLQDEAHVVYLVNTAGHVLWKQPLNEAINSEIFQIDFYKNGRLQFLFSTKNALHLLDREGNYVDKYPVNLRSEASNGMALFDYDSRKEYRIFIAGIDKKIYVYDKDGAVVKGWKFKGTEGLVTTEVQHHRIGTKDYIVIADPMRVYILNRKGDTRVTPSRQFAKSVNNSLILDRQSSKGARLITTDVEGTVWYTYFSGAVEKKELSGYSAEHFFQYDDINGDGRKDFIFADQDRLEVLSADGKRIFDKKLSGKITHSPSIYRFPGNSREIGVVSRNKEEIYLFKANGMQHEGFPLRGRTQFSIGYLDPSSKQFNLLVGGDDLFLLNYKVN
ncbi:MAG: DUF3352 domain-containing protein [Bacteroidales bacterium]|nr:DUF3352 domain-containing protein [Bacteroidales bacterium]